MHRDYHAPASGNYFTQVPPPVFCHEIHEIFPATDETTTQDARTDPGRKVDVRSRKIPPPLEIVFPREFKFSEFVLGRALVQTGRVASPSSVRYRTAQRLESCPVSSVFAPGVNPPSPTPDLPLM